MSDTVTKRLHVSGLTPALTPADLSARLSTFGTVKALDGFGLLDGVGQPRKFGYVTIEATPAALKRCFTSLSGTTWKGAKLRIGEAKPDYRERIAEERAKANEEPPRKRQRTHFSKYHGVYANDMSPVTRENAETRPGWKVMPSGRVVRPMRMRPGKPLPPNSDDARNKRNTLAQVKEKKKKIKLPDTRARIRSIDVTKWNGEYLRGSLLDGQITATSMKPRAVVQTTALEEPVSEEEAVEPPQSPVQSTHQPRRIEPEALPTTSAFTREDETAPRPHTASDPTSLNFVQERAQNLSLLNALLGDAEWDGRESDSDIDESRIIEGHGGNEDYEIVPAERPSELKNRDVAIEVDEPSSTREAEATKTVPPPTNTQPVSLKDLFAPREEEGGFSLLNHLDLELDDELDIMPFSVPSNDTDISAPVPQTQPAAVAVAIPSLKSKTQQRINLDPKMPLFFPRAEMLSATTAKVKDPSPFYQVQTEEQIRQRWEENKVELTRGWRKRWREAVKVKRRRGGKDGDGDI
ncbi:hypothetical protein V5O48_001007 [Marasmius crinis-equi]|uniref:RRM domain-containing protein n=1 Tax=Marasmius crinis-equi TaxID=585013 RepID=A0ABR3FZQ5_9AGAR